MLQSPDVQPVRVYIGLGGNLEQPAERIRSARPVVTAIPGIHEVAFSSLYRSAPMGPSDQPDYVNAVMAVDTILAPLTLLDELQAVENAFGRVRLGDHWGPRTLDLDILLYGDLQQISERLTVPHVGLSLREFVLYPLQEIAPELDVPGLGALGALVQACPRRGLSVIADV